MEYTNVMLILLGLFGVVVHNLFKINKINKSLNGNFKFGPFIALEWPSICISVCLVIVCVIAKVEIKKLDAVGEYLGLGFVFIGYGGQSFFYSFFGRAEKKIKDLTGDSSPSNDQEPSVN